MYKWNEHRYMETGRFEINKVCHEVMNIAKNIVGNNEINQLQEYVNVMIKVVETSCSLMQFFTMIR